MTDTIIGKYRVTRTLGAGGMGVVYAAEHTLIGRKAAVKVLLPEFSNEPEIVERFFNEARSATAIRHPGIVQIYDFGYEEDGSAFISMELMEGESLGERIERVGRLPLRQALRFTGQIASALASAHEYGIIHRDLKPPNIFVVPDKQVPGGERIKLLDFGIAKFSRPDKSGVSKTRAGAMMGSPSYMSPEQCRGAGEVDVRADLYSVGCILFAMLCGRPPFVADDAGPMAIVASQLYDEPPIPSSLRPELTPEVDALVLGLLRKDPEERPQNAGELAQIVMSISGEQVSFDTLPTAQMQALPDMGSTTATTQKQSWATGRGTARITGRQNGVVGNMLSGHINAGEAGQVAETGVTGAGDNRARSSMGGNASVQIRSSAGVGSNAGLVNAGSPQQTTHDSPRGRKWIYISASIALAAGFALMWMLPSSSGPNDSTVTTQEAQPTQPGPQEEIQPKPKPKPKLTFYTLADEEARKRAQEEGGTEGDMAASMQVASAGGIEAVAPGLAPFSLSSVLSGTFFKSLASAIRVVITPEPPLVVWHLQTDPPGAEILRDGEVVGTTDEPMVIRLEQTAGYVETFTLRRDRYRESEVTFYGEESSEQTIVLEPRVYVMVQSVPEGAEVFDADGSQIGVAPFELEMPENRDEIAVVFKKERYQDTPATLSGEMGTSAEVTLVPKVYATVTSRPADGVEVLAADGQVMGMTPLEVELVADSEPMRVTLRRDRYEDQIVELAGEKTFTERVRLTPKVYATVESRPKGAEIFSTDGTSLGTAPVEVLLPSDSESLLALVLRHPDYLDTPVELERKRRSYTTKIKLLPRVFATIESRPSGAAVLAEDGSSMGQTPMQIELSQPGVPANVKVQLAGYRDSELSLTGKRSFKKRVRLAKLPTLSLVSEPQGAAVIDASGKRIGNTPLEIVGTGDGEAMQLTLSLPDHQDSQVEWESKRSRKMRVKLSQKLAPIQVAINSRPAGAEVWREGELLGNAPVVDELQGREGRIRYTLKLDGYRDREVRIAGNTSAEETVRMKKCAPKRNSMLGLVSVYEGCD